MAVVASNAGAAANGLQVRSLKERFTAQDFVGWAAPYTNGTAPAAPAALTGIPANDALTSPWVGLGWLSDSDGMTASRAVTVVNQTGYGSRAPLRSLITAETETFKFTSEGTVNLPATDLWTGQAPGTTTAPASGSPYTWYTGTGTYPIFSCVLDGFDGTNQVRIYIPAAQVTTPGDESWKPSDNINRPLTITATLGSAGFSARREVFVH